MKTDNPPHKFIVPYEVFLLLDPIERIVIRAQEERGDVIITKAGTVQQ